MTQQAPMRSYFISRNRITYLSLHTNIKIVKKAISNILKEAKHMAYTKRYSTCDSMCAALEDYLRKGDWFEEDLSKWIKNIRWPNREKAMPLYSNLWMTPICPIYELSKESYFNRFLRKISFNGHIFSNLLHAKSNHPSSSHHRCIPFGVCPMGVNIERIAYKSSSILYYDDRSMVGLRVEHNTWMFWRAYLRLIITSIKCKLFIYRSHKKYNYLFHSVTTMSWWKNRLGI
jgi:hypothetical protein